MIRIVPKWTKKIRNDPIRLGALRRPGALASAYAEHVLRVVKLGGQSADSTGAVRRRPHASKKKRRPFAVVEPYARAAGVDDSFFRSSAEFHRAAGARRGAYNVTSGMWDGLKVSASKTAAVVGFGKSSVGARSSTIVKYKYRKHSDGSFEVVGKVEGTSRVQRVENRVKARKVLQHHGINVLAFRRGEVDALSAAVGRYLGVLVVEDVFGVSLDFKADRFDRNKLSRRAYARLSRG